MASGPTILSRPLADAHHAEARQETSLMETPTMAVIADIRTVAAPRVTATVLEHILVERAYQDKQYGPCAGFGNVPLHVKFATLAKKVADYQVALCQRDGYFAHLQARAVYDELVAVAAVAVALLEEMSQRS